MPTHVPTTGAEGSPFGPLDKPLDKPAKQYIASEDVSQDTFHEEPLTGSLENDGDFSKKFA